MPNCAVLDVMSRRELRGEGLCFAYLPKDGIQGYYPRGASLLTAPG